MWVVRKVRMAVTVLRELLSRTLLLPLSYRWQRTRREGMRSTGEAYCRVSSSRCVVGAYGLQLLSGSHLQYAALQICSLNYTIVCLLVSAISMESDSHEEKGGDRRGRVLVRYLEIDSRLADGSAAKPSLTSLQRRLILLLE